MIEKCFRVKTSYGHYDACFRGRSAYEKGKMNVTAYDRKGYYMPQRSGDQEIEFEDFEDIMSELANEGVAKRIS